MPGRFILGVELGGTKTTAILMRADNAKCWIGRGGPSTPNSTAPEIVSASLEDAIGSVCKSANLDSSTNITLVVATEGDIRDVQKCAERHARIEHVHRIHEGEAAHLAAFGKRDGIVVLCGTGSVGWARNSRGEVHIASSWGTVGDEGSGYWIGREGLAAAFKAADGRGRETSLVDKILKDRKITDLRDMVGWLYEPGLLRQRVASFAPLVLAEAAHRDTICRKIIDSAAADAAKIVKACREAVYSPEDATRCAAFGGLFRSKLYRRSFSDYLGAKVPYKQDGLSRKIPLKVRDDAIVGTIRFGLAQSGVEIDQDIEDALSSISDQLNSSDEVSTDDEQVHR